MHFEGCLEDFAHFCCIYLRIEVFWLCVASSLARSLVPHARPLKGSADFDLLLGSNVEGCLVEYAHLLS